MICACCELCETHCICYPAYCTADEINSPCVMCAESFEAIQRCEAKQEEEPSSGD